MKKLELSLIAIKTLRFLTKFEESKIVGNDGKEINAPRVLSGEDSAQRRFFWRITDSLVEEDAKLISEKVQTHNLLLEKKKEGMDEQEVEKKLSNDKELVDSLKKLNEFAKENNEKKHEMEITENTFDFLSGVFRGWQSWAQEDDFIYEELNQIFKKQ